MTMSKLLRRYVELLKASLDTLMAPAVDPRRAFAGTYERQRELLALARQALLDIAATRAQLEARIGMIEAYGPQHEQQALRALAAGQEDLARLALRRRHMATGELSELKQHVQELQRKEQALALHEERLAGQVQAFEARAKLIAASYSAAEAQARISEAFAGVSTEMGDLSRVLEHVEQQAEHLQTRVAGIEMSVEDELIEAELAALKQQFDVSTRPEEIRD
jgi:phage shock protein A